MTVAAQGAGQLQTEEKRKEEGKWGYERKKKHLIFFPITSSHQIITT